MDGVNIVGIVSTQQFEAIKGSHEFHEMGTTKKQIVPNN